MLLTEMAADGPVYLVNTKGKSPQQIESSNYKILSE